MVLRALNFQGYLDISAPEILGSTEYEWLGATAQFRRTMKAGDIVTVPDEFYRFPNITNAVEAGLLEIVSFDKRKEQIVIHAESTGGTGAPGTKYLVVDIHGGADTAVIKDVNNVPALVFEDGCSHRSKWNITIPEDYQSGTPIYVEVYWGFSGGGPANVNWIMEYKAVATGGAMGGPVGSSSFLQPVVAPGMLYTTGTSLVIPPAGIASEQLLMIAIRRDAKDALDTLSASVYVHLVKVNYTGLIFYS
jgi:hypothetical protein